MSGLFYALLSFGGIVAIALVITLLFASQLFQVVMRLLDHHRSSQKALIEKLNFTEHFFEKIAGKNVQPLVRERAIHILTGRANIKVHELEYLLHLEDIDQKIKEYYRLKPDLCIDKTKALPDQLQFRDGLETESKRKKYIRNSFMAYVLFSFLAVYTPIFMAIKGWSSDPASPYLIGVFSIVMIFLAFSFFFSAARVESAQQFRKSISEYWAGQSD